MGVGEGGICTVRVDLFGGGGWVGSMWWGGGGNGVPMTVSWFVCQ